jgi:hypothetical protein
MPIALVPALAVAGARQIAARASIAAMPVLFELPHMTRILQPAAAAIGAPGYPGKLTEMTEK